MNISDDLIDLSKAHIPIDHFRGCEFVCRHNGFLTSPGSATKHHNFDGGLAQHTFEVVNIGLKMSRYIPNFNTGVFAVAAIWHDFGKIWEYVKDESGKWVYSPAKALTGGHLSRSYAEYLQMQSEPTEFNEQVCHCILAHHGLLEWGSPVTPQTNEAWVLHLADMTSAKCLGKQNGLLQKEKGS